MGAYQSQSQFQSSPESLLVNNNLNLNKRDYTKLRRTETIADLLVTKFNNPEYKGFYWKVASSLPENMIWNYVEQANKGNNPARYFSFLCKKAGV